MDFLLHVAFLFLFYCEALMSSIDNASACGGCVGLGVCLGGGTVGFQYVSHFCFYFTVKHFEMH